MLFFSKTDSGFYANEVKFSQSKSVKNIKKKSLTIPVSLLSLYQLPFVNHLRKRVEIMNCTLDSSSE